MYFFPQPSSRALTPFYVGFLFYVSLIVIVIILDCRKDVSVR